MTATKITTREDGTPILETWDFRSEFAFDDFASWLADSLGIQPASGEVGEDMEPFSFEWNSAVFEAAWNDEHGCFVAVTGGQHAMLGQMQKALSS